MKKLLLILTLISAPSIFAKSIECRFTEPFISLVYHADSSSIHYHVFGERNHETISGIREVSVNETTTELYEGDKLVLTLIEDGQGNDGMSDEIMPISAITNVPQKIYGGCK